MANLVKLSKFLSLILRHEPDKFGLQLDADGFVDLKTVWYVVNKKYGALYARQDLDALILSDGGKQRFEVRANRIRALYGHSTEQIEVTYPAVTPPDVLYHGTTPQALDSIRRDGLTAQSRQYVHLSTDVERAADVAHRRGKAVILKIRAKDAHDAGYIFHNPEPKHYLVKAVPPEFIDFPE